MLYNGSVDKTRIFEAPERGLLPMPEDDRTIERIVDILSSLSPENRAFALRLAEQAGSQAAADTIPVPLDQAGGQSR